jgi:cystathionine gamma-lyase
MHFETLVVHAGQNLDTAYGAVMTPIYQTSTFAFKGMGIPGPFDYSRSGNPTRKALENCLAEIEGGMHGFAFATGMAAEVTCLMLLNAGEHILVHDDLYGGTYRLLTSVLQSKGIEISFVNMRDLDSLVRHIRVNTRVLWLETPTNPMMNLLDLAEIASIAHEKKLITICDNTFLSPYFQQPLKHGIDVVLHSTTKYINGHSDVVGGAAVVKDPGLAEKIGFLQNAMGTCAGPMDSFLVLRGIKTLALRMEAHNRNALGLAKWLESHKQVVKVFHPGLESHPQHDLALKQMSGYGGTFSFLVKGGVKKVKKLVEGVHLFTLAESLGGVESLIEHPWSMTHVSMPENVRRESGITDDLVRVSVGIENLEDLIEDIAQALG